LIENQKTGLLVSPRDPHALMVAIREVLSNPTAASKMGAEGRAVVRERFTVDRMVANTTAIFDVALHDAGIQVPIEKRMAA
jgi:glycosyltransferase involved in cell wall biosynthesis